MKEIAAAFLNLRWRKLKRWCWKMFVQYNHKSKALFATCQSALELACPKKFSWRTATLISNTRASKLQQRSTIICKEKSLSNQNSLIFISTRLGRSMPEIFMIGTAIPATIKTLRRETSAIDAIMKEMRIADSTIAALSTSNKVKISICKIVVLWSEGLLSWKLSRKLY